MSSSIGNHETINIRYSKTVGILLTAVSSIGFFLNFYVFLLSGNFPIAIITSIIIFISGILYLTKICFSITSNNLYIYNLLGRPIKQYSLNSLEDLTIENDKIYLQMHEGRKKLPIAKWITNQNDWEILKEKINRQKQTI